LRRSKRAIREFDAARRKVALPRYKNTMKELLSADFVETN